MDERLHLVDWLIVAVPMVLVFYVAMQAQRFVKSVSDFLAAGRVAGRYVVAVASGEAGMGLISVVALFEAYYNSGFAYSFWNQLYVPVGMLMTLTGYCIYRYRETRAMTMGQFFEMRYSRGFRIYAACLQSLSGVVNYAIFPAVGARFLIYYCDLPLVTSFFGWHIPTFALVMALFLSAAVLVVSLGGQITIMVTDCILGILSYPLYAIVVIALLVKFSWSGDMEPSLLDRPAGESMLNPFDIDKLRDFNLFYIFVGLFSNVFNRMAWSGTQGYNAAAINAHEQKMGAVLGTWRAGFQGMMILLLAVAGYTYMNNDKFEDGAAAAREELTWKAVRDVAVEPEFDAIRGEVRRYLDTGEMSADLVTWSSEEHFEDKDENEPLRDMVKEALASEDKSAGQTFGAIHDQMRVPIALRHILPIGVTGVFCALCVFLLISTDTTYMHSWGSIIVQDIVLPIRGRAFTAKQQLRLLRLIIAGVAVFAFFFSLFFAQVDYILMFFAITGAIWLGGAGPCIVGGLYWRRGTAQGAFAALTSGSLLAVGGIIAQKTWVKHIYPWMEETERLPVISTIVEGISRPLEPYVEWRVLPDKFPINSQEIYFLAMLIGVLLYVGISLLTGKESFNMERMLHRGKYRREGEDEVIYEPVTWRTFYKKFLGINSEYTKGDKILAWSVFLYSMLWGFGSFVVLVAWNAISPWPDTWWAEWFKIYNLVVPGIIAVVSTVWFTIGGSIDLRRLFQRLGEKQDNMLDDGRVIGHVSADDVEHVEDIEHDK
ncbi:MAG: sodium:panthothenate symporter [Gemmatimonadetes bacterium]|nr:sodium:panthothenate symporter [Gemmatimonadota bacterium]